ncbi:hypothetical protein SDC9_82739 [bioreactor metagenome]|uniref:Uncharacterized protein n=1 Tax=bioreactor metagenome TaxID=1076179 RepID=A0A644ZE34_9ZZZZ
MNKEWSYYASLFLYMGFSKGLRPFDGSSRAEPSRSFLCVGFSKGLCPFDGSSRAEPSLAQNKKIAEPLGSAIFVLCLSVVTAALAAGVELHHQQYDGEQENDSAADVDPGERSNGDRLEQGFRCGLFKRFHAAGLLNGCFGIVIVACAVDLERVLFVLARGYGNGEGIVQSAGRRGDLAAAGLKGDCAGAAAAGEADIERIAGVHVFAPAGNRENGLVGAHGRAGHGLLVGCFVARVARFANGDGISGLCQRINRNNVNVCLPALEARGAAFVGRNGSGSRAVAARYGDFKRAARGCAVDPAFHAERALWPLERLAGVGARGGGFVVLGSVHQSRERVAARGGDRYGELRFGRTRRGRNRAAVGEEADVRSRDAAADANGEGVVAAARVGPTGNGERRRGSLRRDSAGKRAGGKVPIIARAGCRNGVGAYGSDFDFVFVRREFGDFASHRFNGQRFGSAAAVNLAGKGVGAGGFLHPAVDMDG